MWRHIGRSGTAGKLNKEGVSGEAREPLKISVFRLVQIVDLPHYISPVLVGSDELGLQGGASVRASLISRIFLLTDSAPWFID